MPDDVIVEQLGDDTDLLLNPDDWLDNESESLQQRMSLMAEELDRILLAKRIKRQLQQQNRVAVRYVLRDDDGNPVEEKVIICTIQEALALLEKDKRDPNVPSDIAQANARQHITIWRRDGYDIEGSRRVKPRQK